MRFNNYSILFILGILMQFYSCFFDYTSSIYAFLMLSRLTIIILAGLGVWLYGKNKFMAIIQFVICGIIGLFFYKFTGIGEIGSLLMIMLGIWMYYDYHKENEVSPDSNIIVDKKKYWYIPVLTVFLIIVVMIGSMFIDNSSYNSYDNYDNGSYDDNYDFSSFNIDDCQDISYKQINKDPNKYYGENIKFKGKVMQIYEGGNTNYLLMYVNGDYGQLLYVEYYNDTDIIEDDYITVYGVCSGSYSYETKIGRTNTVPSMYGASLVKN